MLGGNVVNLIIIWVLMGLAGTAAITYGAANYSHDNPKDKISTWLKSLSPGALLLAIPGPLTLLASHTMAVISYSQQQEDRVSFYMDVLFFMPLIQIIAFLGVLWFF